MTRHKTAVVALVATITFVSLGSMSIARQNPTATQQEQNTNNNANQQDRSTNRNSSRPDRNMNENVDRQEQNMNGNMNSNMSGQPSRDMGGSTTLSSSDRKFMMMAAMGGMAEIETARLALQNASSDSVKQYAQKMIDDHTKAGDELKQIAAAKGITLPTGPDAKHQAAMEKLRGLTGAKFDREYIKMAGTKDHREMEKLYQREVSRGTDADTKAFAAKTLPVVQEHLRMAQEMSASMTGGMNSNMSNSNTSNANRP